MTKNLDDQRVSDAAAYEMVPMERKSSHKHKPDISWSSMSFNANGKAILTDCWGKVDAGKVCAIMGPSGAGKSSLLNVLAGRSAPAPGITIEGKVTVGGKVINPVSFRKNIAYVMQDDALVPTATPREALTFSASMRLPATYTNAKIQGIVEKLIGDLGLEGCADVMIGGAMIKGISGGQRKRVSVGVELVTDPALLFLDEPTSGLDSYTAFSIVTMLRALSNTTECTVLCTIHQPSSEVFFLFDSVIFMKAGRIFYQGPCKEVTSVFGKLGYHCPHSYNPSDFVMSLTQTVSHEEALAKNLYMAMPDELQDLGNVKTSSRLDGDVEFLVERSFLRQLGSLTYREAVSTSRDTGALIGRFGITAFLNLLFGLIFLGVGGKDYGDATNFNNHFGAVAMVLISGMFGSAQPVMLSFPFERPIFMREYSTGTYGASAYFISKMLIEIPLTFVQMVEAYLLVYFMLDLQGHFLYIVLAAFGLGLCSSSVAVMLGCSLNDVKQVTEMAPLLFVPQMMFVGFFIPTSKIPLFLRWAQYLCSLKYAMNLIIMTEFRVTSESCQSSPQATQNCENLMKINDIETDRYYIYILVLFALFIGFRLIGASVLVQRAKRFY